MLRQHVIKHLSAYYHEELTAAERMRVEAHLRECSKCQAAYDEIRLGAQLASVLLPSSAPQSIWVEMQAKSSAKVQNAVAGTTLALRATPPNLRGEFRVVAAVSLTTVVAFAAGLFLLSFIRDVPSWEVAVRGTARIGNLRSVSAGRLRAGEALQTDSSSEAQIKIADIGELSIDPNTRIRLLVTKANEHRIALERGKLEARTWSPPRLFIVDTPSATAIDLGCKYTLDVEDDGSSLLHVTLGLVALELRGRETVVPAGAFCRTRPRTGPGTPYFEDSSKQFQSALDALDVGKEGADRTQQLQIVLRESHLRDALTLWHLIPRLDADSRGLIYDRLAELLPPPPGVTRSGIIALDKKMLETWQPVVAQLWQ